MTPKEHALKLCQQFGITTLFEQDCNGGVTLPLAIAKKCALIAADLCYQEAYKQGNQIAEIRQDYWKEVKAEIEKL